jgi:glutathionylspermidine synthase
MHRLQVIPRVNKNERLESRGLSFHAWDNYWNESAAYVFSAAQVDEIETATNTLLEMCETACQYILDNGLLGKIGIPEQYHEAIYISWEREDVTLYGRFDLAYDGVNAPKMLEFNADTPTSLLESAVSQWDWLEDTRPSADQFNSLHDKLKARWKKLPASVDTIHFASLDENEEDWVCVHYLMETALQAGYKVKHVYLSGLGYDKVNKVFVDGDNEPIQALFKLYPWEWMMREEFGPYTIECKTELIEPMWKAMLSTKAILPILWRLFPGHRYLLPAFFEGEQGDMTSYAKKPFYSREGADIKLVREGQVIAEDEVGNYGAEGYIYQKLVDLRNFGDSLDPIYPIIGAWVVGDEAAGMCIREDSMRITTNMSNFVPHFFE